MPLTILQPKILAGASLGNSIDATGGTPLFLVAPVAWDPANISFQVSGDGSIFGDLFTADGVEMIMPLNAGTTIPLTNLSEFVKGTYFKIRSGSRDHPIVQSADRQFWIALGP